MNFSDNAGQHARSYGGRRNRVLYAAIVFSFLLPFVSVRSCGGDESTAELHTGIDVIGEDAGVMLVGVILLALVMLALSFRRFTTTPAWSGVGMAVQALLCAIALLTTSFATLITFMFNRVTLQVGFYICVGSWFLLHTLNLNAARENYAVARRACGEPPPPWGAVVGALTVVVVVTSFWVSQPDGLIEVSFGVLSGYLVGVPLIALAMLCAVVYRCRRGGGGAPDRIRL